MTYMHVVTKAMLLLCCIQTMDTYSPPPPRKKKKRGKGRTKQHDPPRRYAPTPYLIGYRNEDQ